MRPARIREHGAGRGASRGGRLFVYRGVNSLPVRYLRWALSRGVLGVLTALFLSVALAGQDAGAVESVMVRCGTSCEVLAASILAFGGNVTFRYENVAALAATLPSDRLPDLLAIAGERAVWKDRLAPVPAADSNGSGSPDGRGASSASLDGFDAASLDDEQVTQVADYHPDGFAIDNNLTGAAALHAIGAQGKGVIVAVIDSGTANWSGGTALKESIVGGESLVDDSGPGKSATSRFNNPHGTQVATIIAAHGQFQFSNTSALVRSLTIHSPGSVILCPTPLSVSCPKGFSLVPMIGTAPASKIYAMKVVKSLEGGAPESRLVAAMDRVLTLRRNFNAGMPSVPVRGTGSEDDPFVFDSLKIQVVNMSIGGPTLLAGQGLADELTLEMLRAGIVVVASAGNNGPAAMTGGSPGTGRGALTVGAASSYVNERVLRDTQFGVGSGVLYRPLAKHQMWSMSSRGPTADGRFSPDLVANGFAAFAQSARCAGSVCSPSFDLVTGTSFSAPTVAGAAALLVDRAPWAPAVEIRNALIGSADPAKLGDAFARIDQGRGWVDIPAARALLNEGVSSRIARGLGSELVRWNIRALGIRPVRFTGDQFVTRVQGLQPGQVAHFFVNSPRNLADITVKLTDIVVEDPEHANVLFGDNLLLHVVDAPTSLAEIRVNEFVEKDSTFVIEQPQHGLMRVAVAGAFSNGGPVSATLTIERHREILNRPTETGRVRQGDLIPIQVDVQAGTKELTFDLSWESDWSRYPTADIDLLLVDPLGATNSQGATLSSPERVTIADPTPGVWTAYVSAITIHRDADDDDDGDHHRDRDGEWHIHDHGTCTEEFALRALADGQRLPRLKAPKPPRRRSH